MCNFENKIKETNSIEEVFLIINLTRKLICPWILKHHFLSTRCLQCPNTCSEEPLIIKVLNYYSNNSLQLYKCWVKNQIVLCPVVCWWEFSWIIFKIIVFYKTYRNQTWWLTLPFKHLSGEGWRPMTIFKMPKFHHHSL